MKKINKFLPHFTLLILGIGLIANAASQVSGTININSSNLQVGQNSATVQITAENAINRAVEVINSPQNINLIFNVSSAPSATISVNPTSCNAPCSPVLSGNSQNISGPVIAIYRTYQSSLRDQTTTFLWNQPSNTGWTETDWNLSAGTYNYCVKGVDSNWKETSNCLAQATVIVNLGPNTSSETASLTINGQTSGSFRVGDNWNLNLTTNPALANKPVQICATQNGNNLGCTTYGNTDSNGVWSLSGQFDSSTIGSWTEYAIVDGRVQSNTINFTVSSQRQIQPPRQTQPPTQQTIFYIEPASATLNVGESRQFRAYFNVNYDFSERAPRWEDVTYKSSWSSDNIYIASINNSGLTTAQSQGSTLIRAVYEKRFATAQVIVNNNLNINPTFYIIPSSVTLNVGQTQQFRAYYDSDGNGSLQPQDVTNDTVWISSDASVVSINNYAFFGNKGLATAWKAGSATITGEYNSRSSTASVNVSGSNPSNPTNSTAYLTINGVTTGSFKVGEPWTLGLTTNPALINQSVQICATHNGNDLGCTTYPPNTNNFGSWYKSGTFDESVIGSWTEYAIVGGSVISNTISFDISSSSASSTTQPSTTQPAQPPGGGGGGNQSTSTSTHLECQNNQCVSVLGSGINRCSRNEDCGSGNSIPVGKCELQNGAPVCVNRSCNPNIPGDCNSECKTDSDCGTAGINTHLECQNNTCVIVNGSGQNQCAKIGKGCQGSIKEIIPFKPPSLNQFIKQMASIFFIF